MYNFYKVICMKKVIHSGILSFVIIMLIQIAVFVSVILWLNEYSGYIIEFINILTAVLLVYEINRNDEPAFKYAWIIIIAILPVFGCLLYMYIHINVITKKINERAEKVEGITKEYLVQDKKISAELEKGGVLDGLSFYLNNYSNSPTYKNTSVEYFPLGEYKFEKMKEELEKAEKFIFMEYFIIDANSLMWQEIFEILKRKAKENVEVRFIYDAMGSLTTFTAKNCEELEKCGIKCRTFKRVTPLFATYQNNRDHRKILVIDGHTAFTGGINIADEYINRNERFGHWKDTAVMIKGQGAVSFTIMFLQMWNTFFANDEEIYEKYVVNNKVECEGYVIPYCDSPTDNENVGERVYLDIINRASSYVYIMTPYLVISHDMQEALKFAAKRGVDVRIVMPHIPDKPYALWLARSYYPKLMGAGVKIFEYEKGFVHGKVTVSDGMTAVVGTINYDYRSLYLNYECALLMHKVSAISDIENDFVSTQNMCKEVTMEGYKKFNIFGRLFGMVIKLFAPLI